MADATPFHRATPSWLFAGPLHVCGCAATASGCMYAGRPGRTVAMACGDSQPLIGIQAACAERPAYAPLSRRPRFGKVVNIGSNLVYNPVVTYYDYTAAKAALVGLTRNLAAELGPSRTCRKGSGLRDRGYLPPGFVLDTGRQMLPVPCSLLTYSYTDSLTVWRAYSMHMYT